MSGRLLVCRNNFRGVWLVVGHSGSRTQEGRLSLDAPSLATFATLHEAHTWAMRYVDRQRLQRWYDDNGLMPTWATGPEAQAIRDALASQPADVVAKVSAAVEGEGSGESAPQTARNGPRSDEQVKVASEGHHDPERRSARLTWTDGGWMRCGRCEA